MMDILQLPRGGGKTHELIHRANQDGGYIACLHRKEAQRVFDDAQKMGKPIQFPVTFGELIHWRQPGFGPLHIDNADMLLQYIARSAGCELGMATMTDNDPDILEGETRTVGS